MSRNSTANILNLDTQSQVSVVIFTYIFVRFLAGSEGLQGKSCSFEQVTKQPAKPCPRAEEGRGLLTQSRRPPDGSKALPSPPSLPSSSGEELCPCAQGRNHFPGAEGLGSTGNPCHKGPEGTRGLCVTTQVQSAVSESLPLSL